jgi:hypothetical protein
MVHVYLCFIISIKFKSYNLFYDDSDNALLSLHQI